MLGGAGYNSILDSTEYVTYNVSTKKWKTRPGPTLPFPMMGHCAVLSRDGHKPIFRLPADRAASFCCAKSPLPVTLDFRNFDFRDFRFTAVYNSILFSSLLVLLSNLDFRGLCLLGFILCPHINSVNRGMPVCH